MVDWKKKSCAKKKKKTILYCGLVVFGGVCETKTLRSLLSRCGGSLISRRHVVTAGHCVARATPRQVHVTLGDYVINSAVEPLPAYTFGVRKIDVHPYFKFTPQADRFDVSVLTLERPVHLMPHIGECFSDIFFYLLTNLVKWLFSFRHLKHEFHLISIFLQ